ncbi:MAG: Wzz/FepE/Etk N-terminal domain-containing protein [Candidatus Eisenbacteria bacterium]
MEDSVSLTRLVYLLFRNRRVIVVSTLIAVIVAGAVSFVLPKWYRAGASILPPESGTGQADIIGIMRFAGYQPAMIPTITSPSEIYSAILKSYRVTNSVIDSLDLIEAYRAKTRVKAIGTVEKHRDVSVSAEGLVKIAYEDRDRVRSAEVANAFVRELDRFNMEVLVGSAKRVREFIENRIQQTVVELEIAETYLKEFKESTGAVLISEQTKVSIETAAEIYGRIAQLEVDLERLRQFATDRSPEVIDIRSQIRALERKLAEMGYMTSDETDGSGSKLFPRFDDAPKLEKRLGELMREVEIKRAVYAVLSEQYENAKIQEMKNTPTLQVLDWAHPPLVRSKPRRKAIVAVTGVFAFLLSSFVVLSREKRHLGAAAQPERAAAEIFEMLRGDLRAIGGFFRQRPNAQ